MISKKYTITVFTFSLLIIFACKAARDHKKESSTIPKGLTQEWIRSPEEDDLQVGIIYRPKSYQFPPSRGRESMIIEEDGTLISRKIAPTDGMDTYKGNWKFDTQTDILTLMTTPDSEQKYKLIYVDFDKLAIQIIPSK